MNITFLIGNGFDLGLGMKSSFMDFLPLFQLDYKKRHSELSGLAKETFENQSEWSYFESQLGKYTEKFDLNGIDEFKNQINEFQIEFANYLNDQENQLDFNNNDIIRNQLISGLKDFYLEKNFAIASSKELEKVVKNHSNESIIYNFISFNYTDCLEKCLKTIPDNIVMKRNYKGNQIIDKIGSVVHVHGFKDSNPIMGVNDESQIANKELASNQRFKKYIIKPIQNKIIRMNYDISATDLIDKSEIICVYGMSIGPTDKLWWKKLINWLGSSPSRQLALFLYNKDYNSSSVYNYMDIEDELIDKLSSYSDRKTVDSLQPRIHIAIHKNIFAMDLRKNKTDMVEEYRKHLEGDD